jgi:SagB-type dehydrogenase family enzyme
MRVQESTSMEQQTVAGSRSFLKDHVRQEVDFSGTHQNQGLPPPPLEKPCDPEALRVPLVHPGEWQGVQPLDVTEAIARRRSCRAFGPEELTLDELSYLLWTTQGMLGEIHPGTALRTVPSAGCRHALETYVCVRAVEGLEAGVYRYLPVEHQLVLVRKDPALARQLVAATLRQPFVGRAAVTFVWTTVPYRMEWRYDRAAHKVIALDAGHVCQNLYLACAAIGAGTCAIAAYDQDRMDRLLEVDGDDEFVIYLAPVGKAKL